MQLGIVTTSDLSRHHGDVLRRIRCGERLIVVRHKDPVATLQPLDGCVFQPFSSATYDVFGAPVGDVTDELAKLSQAQRALLRDCYKDWRLRPFRLPEHLWSGIYSMLEDLTLRGLAKKTSRGWELTGRGLAIHEALQREVP